MCSRARRARLQRRNYRAGCSRESTDEAGCGSSSRAERAARPASTLGAVRLECGDVDPQAATAPSGPLMNSEVFAERDARLVHVFRSGSTSARSRPMALRWRFMSGVARAVAPCRCVRFGSFRMRMGPGSTRYCAAAHTTQEGLCARHVGQPVASGWCGANGRVEGVPLPRRRSGSPAFFDGCERHRRSATLPRARGSTQRPPRGSNHDCGSQAHHAPRAGVDGAARRRRPRGRP